MLAWRPIWLPRMRYVIPTVREEAAPLVIPQAMAVGVPVIASSIGGITEVIDRPGENGVLVPPGDADALAAAAARLLRIPRPKPAASATQARRRFIDEYTVEAMTARTLAVYEVAKRRLAANAA